MKPDEGLLVVDNEFKDCAYIWSKNLWTALTKEYGVAAYKTKTDLPVCVIPANAAAYRQAKFMSTCLYRATELFVEKHFGVRLTKDDEHKFHMHPLTEPPGTPQPYTARVVSDLVNPYGLAVSRIRMLPGRTVNGDLEQWPHVLGTNPIGFADRTTDNATFAALTGMAPEEADSFAFEFGDAPLRPAICCGWMLDYGSRGAGHAEYEGPDKNLKDLYILQIQVDRTENVKYLQQPVFPELPPKKENYVLDPWETKNKAGNRIEVKYLSTFFQPPWHHKGKGSKSVYEYPKPTGRSCTICIKQNLSTSELVGAGLCIACWAVFTSLFRCPRCGEQVGGKQNSRDIAPFTGLGKSDDQPFWRIGTVCVNCKTTMQLKALPGTAAWAVVAALRGEDGVAALYETTKNKERV